MQPHQHIPISDWAWMAKIIGFAAGTIVSIFLVELVRRDASQRGLRQPHGYLALTMLIWNLGGLIHPIICLFSDPDYLAASLTKSLAYAGGYFWPFTVVNVWLHLPGVPVGRRKLGRIWSGFSLVLALCLSTAIFLRAFHPHGLDMEFLFQFMPLSAALIMTVGGFILLNGQMHRRGIKWGFHAMIAGAYIPSAICILHMLAVLPVGIDSALINSCDQAGLLVLLGLLLFFSNFRFADVFVRRSLGVIAALLASIEVVTLVPFLQAHLTSSRNPDVLWQATLGIMVGALLLLTPFARSAINWWVRRWFYKKKDYMALLRDATSEMEVSANYEQLFLATERKASMTLGISEARVFRREAFECVPHLNEAEFIELPCCHEGHHVVQKHDAEMLFPIRCGGQTTHVLAINRSLDRRSLLSEEAEFLRRLAATCSARLDAMEREKERINLEAGQERLMRQVTEAELRALRAQVNPHFLFNSLNTIAALIPTDPQGAEVMTVRLAKIFRHVLASSERPLASLEEEMQFVDTYLSIEKARFGDRLRVSLDFDPLLAGETIPSLLLQPVVENALKHGLAPKPGVVNLQVSAKRDGDFLSLVVEDDGVGPSAKSDKQNSSGVGLRNLASRLKNLYGDRASLRFEPRNIAGIRVTILIPSQQQAA